MNFEWDIVKAKANQIKHGVSFAEAATVYGDPMAFTFNDIDHSKEEDRYITMGCSERNRFLVVAHTDRGDRIRIISARKATRKERKAYENNP